MGTGFDVLLGMQDDLQRGSMGGSPTELEGEARVEFIRWNVLALEDELHEMLQEVGWKPWATSRHVNEGPALKELVDAFHFFLNLLLAVGGKGDAGELADLFAGEYAAKNRENARRQEEGYDGVSGKCSGCHRDLKDSVKQDLDGALRCVCGLVIPEDEE